MRLKRPRMKLRLLQAARGEEHFRAIYPQNWLPMSTASKPHNELLNASKDSQAKGPQLLSDSIATGIVFALSLTVVQRAIGFGRGILFCRLMDDQQLGQWSMIYSYLMLLAPLAVLGLPGCFGKFTEHFRKRGQLGSFVRRIGWISLGGTLGLSAILFVMPETFSWILFRETGQTSMVYWIASALILVSLSNFLTSLMESLRQVRLVTIMRFVTSVCFAGVAVGLLFFTRSGAVATTAGFALACLAGSIPAIWVIWHYRATFVDSDVTSPASTMWGRIAPFAAWLWIANLMHNLFEVADRYMLIHWSNTTAEMAQSDVGQYHSGRVVPLLLVSVAVMLGQLLMPYMSSFFESGEVDKAKRQQNWTIKLVSLSFTVGGVVVLLFSPLLFDWILQGRYNEGLAVLPMTLVYCIWMSIYSVGQDYLWVTERGKWAAGITLGGLVVNVVMNMLLIPYYGLWGAVAATAIGNAFVLIALYALNHHFECKTDIGIWLSALIPLVLLLGTWPAVAATIGLVAIGFATNWVFSQDEKDDLVRIIRAKLNRGGSLE